jgi:hypothetical protein
MVGDFEVVETMAHGRAQVIRVARLDLGEGQTSQLLKAKLTWAKGNKLTFKGQERHKVAHGNADYAQTWLVIADRLPACRVVTVRDSGVEIPKGYWSQRVEQRGDFSFVDRHDIALRRSTTVAQLLTPCGRYTHELFDAELVSLRGESIIVSGYQRYPHGDETIEYVQGWWIRTGLEDAMEPPLKLRR